MKFQPNPNKERTLPTEDGYAVRYGADTREEDPTVLYLRAKARVTPTVEEDDYSAQVNTATRVFTRQVGKILNQHTELSEPHIFTMDLSPSSVDWKKKSFLRYELFAKPRTPKPMREYEKLFLKLARELNSILDEVLEAQNLARC